MLDAADVTDDNDDVDDVGDETTFLWSTTLGDDDDDDDAVWPLLPLRERTNKRK